MPACVYIHVFLGARVYAECVLHVCICLCGMCVLMFFVCMGAYVCAAWVCVLPHVCDACP